MKSVNTWFKEQYRTSATFVDSTKTEHSRSHEFLTALDTGNVSFAKEFLIKKNIGATLQSPQSRTVCLMDATGSMFHLLEKAKTTVADMFRRASEILKEQGVAEAFEMQIVFYRNYNTRAEQILQASTWESKPENLVLFMKSISVEGGMGKEAIELGLWHVNQECAENQAGDKAVSQVILIGDAPPNTQSDVQTKRHQEKGEAYWSKTKYARPTYYENELKKLAAHRIPVHAFYVDVEAQKAFEAIANATGGRSCELNINEPAGAKMLTDLVTLEILRNIGGEQKGESLVQAYTAKFGQKTYSENIRRHSRHRSKSTRKIKGTTQGQTPDEDTGPDNDSL